MQDLKSGLFNKKSASLRYKSSNHDNISTGLVKACSDNTPRVPLGSTQQDLKYDRNSMGGLTFVEVFIIYVSSFFIYEGSYQKLQNGQFSNLACINNTIFYI